MAKSPDAFRTISEVADWLGVEAHVLRFWETKFTQVKPVKRAGGRRYYRPSDMALLGGIRRLLHDDGLTIRGVQKLLREQGVAHVAALSPEHDLHDAETPRRGRTTARPSAAPSAEPSAAPPTAVPGAERPEEPRHGELFATSSTSPPPAEPPAAKLGMEEEETPRHWRQTPASASATPPDEPSSARPAPEPAKKATHVVDVAPPLPFDLPSASGPAATSAQTGNGADTGLSAAFRAREQRIDREDLAPILSRARALVQRLSETPQ